MEDIQKVFNTWFKTYISIYIRFKFKQLNKNSLCKMKMLYTVYYYFILFYGTYLLFTWYI